MYFVKSNGRELYGIKRKSSNPLPSYYQSIHLRSQLVCLERCRQIMSVPTFGKRKKSYVQNNSVYQPSSHWFYSFEKPLVRYYKGFLRYYAPHTLCVV